MSAAQTAAERLLQWAASFEPAMRRAILEAWQRLQASPSVAELVRRIDAGDLDSVIELLFRDADALAAEQMVRNVYARAVQRLRARAVAKLVVRVELPVADARLVTLVQQWESSAYRNLLAEAQAGLRAQVATELARGIGPRQIAVALKSGVGRVGLTAYDESIIASYRQALTDGRMSDALRRTLRDRRYDRSLAKGTLTPAQIDTMTDAYRRKLIAWRAETFARSSMLGAANDATQQSWRDAVAQGRIPYAEVRRYWIVAADERLCEICAPIPDRNPDGVGLDEPFDTDTGLRMNPTLHPNCRCTVWIRRETPGVAKRAAPHAVPFVFTDPSRPRRA